MPTKVCIIIKVQYKEKNHKNIPHTFTTPTNIACFVYLLSINKKCPAGYAILMGSMRDNFESNSQNERLQREI